MKPSAAPGGRRCAWGRLRALFRRRGIRKAAGTDGESYAIAALLQSQLLLLLLLEQRVLCADEIEASLESLAVGHLQEGDIDPRRAEVLAKVAGLLRLGAADASRVASPRPD